MKKVVLEYIVALFYMTVCLTVYFILVHFHIKPYYPKAVLGFWSTLFVWGGTILIADYLIKKHDRWLLKRKVIKLIKKLKRAQKLEIKKFDIKKVEIYKDGDEEVIEIVVDDEQEEKK